jgi:hypothetical protein
MGSADLPKSELFRRLGFAGDLSVYEQVLEEAGLSRPGKQRISVAKQDQVQEVLERRFLRACQRTECQAQAAQRASGRTVVPAAAPGDCEVCAGSINALAVAEMVKACQRVGWRRLCVVGGSPNTAAQLLELVAAEGGGIEVKVVQGTMSRTRREAEYDIAWADRVVIWGSTELAHKVSALYKGSKVITVARRGIAELAKGIVASAARKNC